MKAVIWLTLFTVMLQFSVTEAFTFPLAAIGLGVVGLAGIKLWAVKKLFRSFGHGQEDDIQIPANLAPIRRPSATQAETPIVHVVRVHDPAVVQNHEASLTKQTTSSSSVAANPAPISSRSRRAASNGMRLNDNLFRWIAKIDDEKCIHRFFCELGVKPRAFGNIGRMANMMLMMRVLPDDSWAVRMRDLGQQKGQGACPTECNETNLQRTLAYLEKHVFEADEALARSENSVFDSLE